MFLHAEVENPALGLGLAVVLAADPAIVAAGAVAVVHVADAVDRVHAHGRDREVEAEAVALFEDAIAMDEMSGFASLLQASLIVCLSDAEAFARARRVWIACRYGQIATRGHVWQAWRD